MLKKGTKLYSIFKGKCPKCNEGDFFKHSYNLHPKKITKLYDNCSNCNQKYMLEPSFYFGAMYVNYGLTVIGFIAFFIITKLILKLTLLQSFISVFIALVIFAPYFLRLSRIIWINMFVSFDAKTKEKKE